MFLFKMIDSGIQPDPQAIIEPLLRRIIALSRTSSWAHFILANNLAIFVQRNRWYTSSLNFYDRDNCDDLLSHIADGLYPLDVIGDISDPFLFIRKLEDLELTMASLPQTDDYGVYDYVKPVFAHIRLMSDAGSQERVMRSAAQLLGRVHREIHPRLKTPHKIFFDFFCNFWEGLPASVKQLIPYPVYQEVAYGVDQHMAYAGGDVEKAYENGFCAWLRDALK